MHNLGTSTWPQAIAQTRDIPTPFGGDIGNGHDPDLAAATGKEPDMALCSSPGWDIS